MGPIERINDRNTVEFYLHPDGSISNFRFIENSKVDILNDTTKETIEIVCVKYPRPKEKRLIRYCVRYDLDKNEPNKEK
jgi:TonB family protein